MKQSATHNGYEFIKASQFGETLEHSINTARQRILISTMTVQLKGKTIPILEALKQALRRGVSVSLFFDVYTKSLFREGGVRHAADSCRTTKKLNELEALGAEVHLSGTMGLNPFANRAHHKVYIIDDTIFSFGGINFTEKALNSQDCMVGFTSKEISEKLIVIVKNIAIDKTHTNQQIPIDEESSTILIDASRDSSLIYNEAIKLARKSKKVHFVSRMCPSGELAKVLQNTTTTYFYNRPSQTYLPTSISIVIDQYKHRLRNSYKKPNYIHAKYILFELQNGEKVVLTGSNNFNKRGADYNTKEIALLTADKALYDSFYEYTKVNLSSSP